MPSIPFESGIDLNGNEIENHRLDQRTSAPSNLLEGMIWWDSGVGQKHIHYSPDGVATVKVLRPDIAETVTAQWNLNGYFTVPGTTKITNLNADLVDGYHGSLNADANTVAVRGAGGRLKVAEPVAADDAATKSYVDAAVQGLDYKESVRVVLETNLANLSSVSNSQDGVTLVQGDRLALVGQTDASENGIYEMGVITSGSGPVTRAGDANSDAEVTSGMYFFVEEGSTNANTSWVLATADPITLDTTNLTFQKFFGAGSLNAVRGLVKSGDNLHFAQNSDYTIGDLFYAASTTTISVRQAVAAGSVLLSQGAGVAPQYGKVALSGGTTHITGVLPIANGGTNSSSALNNNRLMVSDSGAIVERAAITNDHIPFGYTSGAGGLDTSANFQWDRAGTFLQLNKAAGKIIEFDGGQAMITVHDSAGDFNLKAGVDESGNVITGTGAGASRVSLVDHGTLTLAVTAAAEAAAFTDDVSIVLSTSAITLKGNTLPSADSAFNLGSSGVRWAGGYFDSLDVPVLTTNPRITTTQPAILFDESDTTDQNRWMSVEGGTFRLLKANDLFDTFATQLSVYASGGMFVGATPSDPGANNLIVQGSVTAASFSGSGAGITGVDAATLDGIDSTGFVQTSRTLTAGDGLTGGGDLSANRSFAVDSTVVRTTGAQTVGGAKTLTENLTLSRTQPSIRFDETDTTDQNRWIDVSGGVFRLLKANDAFGSFTNQMFVYASGGMFVGATPSDPGANNLIVQGSVTAASFSGSGAGITGVDAATLDGIDSTGFVQTSRTLTAGDGLTGGGDLSANRSFAVDSTVVRTTGAQTLAGIKTFTSAPVISGNAPTIDLHETDTTDLDVQIQLQGGALTFYTIADNDSVRSNNLTLYSSGSAFFGLNPDDYAERGVVGMRGLVINTDDRGTHVAHPWREFHFSYDTDLDWKKVCRIQLPASDYAGVSVEGVVLNTNANNGRAHRSETQFSAYVTSDLPGAGAGHGSVSQGFAGFNHVRLIRTAARDFELQVRQSANYRTNLVRWRVTQNHAGAPSTITYHDTSALASGSTTGTEYLPSTPADFEYTTSTLSHAFNGLHANHLRLPGTGEASLSSTTHALQIGTTAGYNLIMDNDEIQTRNGGASAVLRLNPAGGDVQINGNVAWHAGNLTISDLSGVPTSRTLTAGDGLTGGGDLSANRSFAVDSTVVRTTGAQTLAGVKTFTSSLTCSAATPSVVLLETDTTDQNWRFAISGGILLYQTVNDAGSALTSPVAFYQSGGLFIGNGASDPGANNLRSSGTIHSQLGFRLSAGNGYGLRFWDSDSYKIWMSSATDGTWGGRLDSTSDHNMYFRMTGGTNRGFVFMNNTTPVFQVESDGQVRTASSSLLLNGKSAARVYSETIGNGSDVNLVVTHGLGTRDVVVEVRRVASPYDKIMVHNEANSTSQVTLKFGSAPSTNQYRVTVTG